jgi:hypothetical protein
MPGMGFEATVPLFEWYKTIRALERAATVIGGLSSNNVKYSVKPFFAF